MTKNQRKILDKHISAMNELLDSCDNERAHSLADGILLEALSELGFSELAEAWEKVSEVGFWYA